MSRLVTLTLFLLVLNGIGQARSLPDGIKGADNRVWVNGSEPPWQAIGRIHKAGLGFCTGVLISPDQVLTAAHCIWNKRTGRPIPGKYLFFVAGYHKEEYIAASNIRRLRHDPDYQLTREVELEMVEKDWALLKLEKPISQVPPIPLRRLTARQLGGLGRESFIVQAGFSKDRPYILTVDEHCLIKGKTKGWNLIAHDCDAMKGDSGSPLMIRDDDGLSVIAIHSATHDSGKDESTGLAVPGASIPEPDSLSQP